MKKLLTIAFLTLTTSLSAEILESNITFQLKAYFARLPVTVGNFNVLKPEVVTLKNADVIKFYNDQHGSDFTNKAKIIYRVVVTGGGVEKFYIIQEKNKTDLNITSDFIFTTNSSVVTYKFAISNNTGTQQIRGSRDANFSINGVVEFFRLSGPFNLSYRYIPSKQVSGVNLELLSGTQSGMGNAKLWHNLSLLDCVTEGVFKISPPKVIQAL